MGGSRGEAKGPDFSRGAPLADIPATGALPGHVAGEPVLVIRRPDGLFAINATCSHYGGPLGEGLVVGDTVRCPWHHACFDLRTGEALRAPAFDPMDRWKVEVEGDTVFVRTRLEAAAQRPTATAGHPARVVIVGGGAAGFAAAEMLRRRGFAGTLTMLSADADPPCDRPNLSKDWLAGTAPEDWIPLKPPEFYVGNRIDLRLGVEVVRLDLDAREVVAADGGRFAWDALLLATGAEPVRLNGPGFNRPNVHLLRTVADARRLIAAIQGVKRAVVVGASFIGLEVAASLRHRGLEVKVVAPDAVPLERVMGAEIGRFVKSLHEQHGVRFHLGQGVEAYDGQALTLTDGGRIPAELVVLGVGVRPQLRLATDAGLTIDRGVVVDAAMRTSHPGVWAAGDIARYPEPASGRPARIEHWAVAERQGQVAALSMLGEDAAMTDAPFFWSRHYDRAIDYVGHAEDWDALRIDGSIDAADATVRFEREGRLIAAATLGRERESLKIAAALEDA